MDLTDIFQNAFPRWFIKSLFFKVVLQWSLPSPTLLKTIINDVEEKVITHFSDGIKSGRVENNEK